MNPETPNPSDEQENAKDKEQTVEESVLKDAVDPRDLVMKSGYTGEPQELLSNPAVAPQTSTLNEPDEIREGFKFDRDR